MNNTTTNWPPPSLSPLLPTPPVRRRTSPIAAVVLATAVALVFADASIVALAIPDLYIEFGSTIPAVSWVLTGYALAVAVAGLAWLVLLRRTSGATLALTGAAVFAASSLTAGLAPSLATLIAARVVQGVGGAALVAGSLGVLATLVGDSGRAARWWAAAGVAGVALGPVLGGAVTQLLDWRAVFIIQAPIALMAAVTTVPVIRRPATIHVEQDRRPRGAMIADTALALTFGALVGVLFLGVLLLVVVWGLPPIVGALVVSALPIGTLLAPRLAALTSQRGAVIGGSTMLAGGLVTLAYLPGIQPAWVGAGLALCGLGFGALLHALNRHALPLGSGARAATLTSTARHLGLVLGLAIIAPVLASQVTAAAEVAPLPATKAMLDAPIDGPTKVRIALDIRDLLDDASDGEVPDLQGVFDRNGAGDDPEIAQLHVDIERGVQEVLTRSFRDSFTVAAGFALLAGVVALTAIAMSSGARSSAGSSPRRWSGFAIVGTTLAAAVLLPAAAVHAGTDDFGSPGVADPCTAPPDPFPGDGFDAAAQRLVLSGLNGAACELGISREELVLSLEPRSGVDVAWDRDTIAKALKHGVSRAVGDADERGTLPGWVAGPLRWTIDHAPFSWFLDQLGVA
jgi:predicted MFS family arabinose efflux permease